MEEKSHTPHSRIAAPRTVVSLKDLSDFWMRPYGYKVDPYLRAATTLQAMGRIRAGQVLLRLAHDQERGDRVFILCRMLFIKKRGREFRRPMIGAAFFVGLTDYTGETGYADWPLEPITLIDGIPFLVVQGYGIGGLPENPADYVRYCLTQCDWNTEHFRLRSPAEKRKALEKLLASHKWTRPLYMEERKFLASQTQ